jgi:hypothetical protein
MSYMGSVVDALVGLVGVDLDCCDAADLGPLAAQSLRVRSWLDALDAAIAAKASLFAAQGSSPGAATVLAGGGRRGRRDAESAAARGEICAAMPELGAALAEGDVSGAHVDAVARASAKLDAEGKAALVDHAVELVEAAGCSTPEQFAQLVDAVARQLAAGDGLGCHERLRSQRCVRRWTDRDSGMCNTKLSLDPLADATVWTAINAAVAAARAGLQSDDQRTFDQLQADVVVDLIGGAPGEGRGVPEVSVLIDYTTLLDGLHDASMCETSGGQPLPVATVRRLCCDAEIISVVLGGDGEVLDVGRQVRTATRAQRLALRAMYRTCAHPQCDVRFDDCRIHHVTFWFHGGGTDLVNLVPICERHHHLVHEGGWTLVLHADRRTTWRGPDGNVVYDTVTSDRTCARQPPRRRPATTAAELADDLLDTLDALHTVAGRAPP